MEWLKNNLSVCKLPTSTVGITDFVRERLKISVKTLASWSAYAHSTRPGNPSGPAALRLLTCLKVLLTSATGSIITQSSRKAGALAKTIVCLQYISGVIEKQILMTPT